MREVLDRRLKRITTSSMASDDSYGLEGAFTVTGPRGRLKIISSTGMGWEHVSVSVRRKDRCPCWDEMQWVVNCHPGVLHLWKPIGIDIPRPPSIMVGPK